MLNKLSFPIKSYGDTDFVTGMRAYAALGVLLIHSGGAGLVQMHSLLAQFVFLGQAGVYVFFVISGFSVTASYRSTGAFLPYLWKRFLRIAPLYYTILLALFVLQPLTQGNMPPSWDSEFGVTYNLYSLFMHLSFLSFLDYKITASVIGTEWTLSIEMFWYVLLPLLLVFVTSWQRALVLLAIALGGYFYLQYLQGLSTHPHTRHIFEWSPMFYAASFSLGVLAYYLRPLVSKIKLNPDIILGIAAAAALAMFLIFAPLKAANSPTMVDTLLTVSFFTALFITLGRVDSRIIKTLFLNRAALYLGTISYGIYLIHFPLVSVLDNVITNKPLLFAAVLAATILLSHFSYKFIERPALKLAKKP